MIHYESHNTFNINKILVIIFSLVLFGSCSSNESNDDIVKNDVFLATNPLHGHWYQVSNSDSIVLTFMHGVRSYQKFERGTDRMYGISEDTFKLTESKIVYYNKEREFMRDFYNITNDTLFIKYAKSTSIYLKAY